MLFALLALTTTLSGATSALALQILRGPYLQMVTDSTAMVVWRTDAVAACTLSFGDSDASQVTTPEDTLHVAHLGGLAAGTRYPYRIEAAGVELAGGPDSYVQTAPLPDTGAMHEFLVWGDSGKGTLAQMQVAATLNAESPDFALHVGDIIYPSGEQKYYDPRYYQPYAPLIRHTPVWATLGNHDAEATSVYQENWYLPTNPIDNSELYYSFDYGDIHIVCLNSNKRFGSAVRDWLRADLASTDRRWKILFFHHPLYTCNPLTGVNTMGIADIGGIIDDFGVDLVLCGHEHQYQRSFPIRGDALVDGAMDPNYVSPGGPVYVITGGGAEAKPVDPSSWFTARALAALHFTRVRVQGGELALEAVDVNGQIIDHMTISKPPTPVVRALDLLQPSGGETFVIGESMDVRWASTLEESIRVELSRTSRQGPWERLFETPNDGSEPWTVSGPAADSCWVRVCGVSEAAADTSTTAFRIRMVPLPPGLRIDTPGADVTVADTQTTQDFAGAAWDPDGSVDRVEYRIRGGAWQLATDTSSWSFTAADLQVGANIVEVRAVDDENASSEVASRTITRRPAPSAPSLTIASPAADMEIPHNQTSLALAGTAFDGDGTIMLVECSVRGGSWQPAIGTSNWTFTAVGLVDGDNRIEIRAHDDDGLVAEAAVRTITRMPNLPPSLTMDDPKLDIELPSSESSVEFAGSAFDPDGVIARVEYRVDDGAWQLVSGSSSWSFVVEGLPSGTTWIDIRATDDDGQHSNMISRNVTRRASLEPLVTITVPSRDQSVPETLTTCTFTGTASDADGSAVAVEYRLGTSHMQPETTPQVLSATETDALDVEFERQAGGRSEFGPWQRATGTTAWSFTSGGLRPGDNVFQIRVLDDSGRSSELAQRIIRSTTRTSIPTLEVVAPITDMSTPYRTKTFEVSGTASDPDGSVVRVEYRIGSGDWQVANGTTSWSFVMPKLLVGDNVFQVRALDYGGLQSAVQGRTITRAVPAVPTLSIAVPASDGSLPYAKAGWFSGTAADADGIVTLVQYRVDGGRWSNATGTTSWTFAITDLPIGTSFIEVRALDDDGFASSIASRTIDRNAAIAPMATIVSPAADTTLAWDAFPYVIAGKATDADGEVVRVELRIADGEWHIASGTTTWTFPLYELAVGAHRIEVRAVDDGGMLSSIEARTITLRPTPILPVVDVAFPPADPVLPHRDTAVEFSGTARDDDGAVVRVEYRVAGDAWQTAVGTSSWSFTVNGLPVGTTVVEVRGVDDQGNLSETTTRRITRNDAMAPALDVTTPAADVSLPFREKSYVFSGTAADVDGTVTHVEYRVDGGSWQPAVGTTTWAFTLALFQVRTYAIEVRALDDEGISSAVAARELTRNLPVVPLVAIESPAGDEGIASDVTSYEFRGTATDADGSIKRVEYRIDGGAWHPATGQATWAFTASDLEMGDNRIEVRAVDDDGFASAIASRIITRVEKLASGNGSDMPDAREEPAEAGTAAGASETANGPDGPVANSEQPERANDLGAPPLVQASALRAGFGVEADPNPFNPATIIRYTLAAAGQVDLNVYDVNGRFVANLVHGHRDAGANGVEWRATTSTGEPLASGVYIARLRSGSYAASVKLLLVR